MSNAPAKVERPEIVDDEHLTYLDLLRENGSINMFGARPYLADEFGLSKADSSTILKYWMESYGERHP